KLYATFKRGVLALLNAPVSDAAANTLTVPAIFEFDAHAVANRASAITNTPRCLIERAPPRQRWSISPTPQPSRRERARARRPLRDSSATRPDTGRPGSRPEP